MPKKQTQGGLQTNFEEQLCVSQRISFILVFCVSMLCYSNTLQAGFVYDDTRAILRNPDLRPDKPIGNIFRNDFWGTALSHSGSHKSYRPLCVLSFRFNYIFGELNASGYHMLNVILHGIVSCLFVNFCLQIFKKEWLALIGGLMFATHPVHTEAVAGIVGRADIGAAMFYLIALISYHISTISILSDPTKPVSRSWFLLSLLMSICSMYTKEQGVTVLGLIVVYEVLMISRCNLAHPKSALEKLKSTGGLHRITVLVCYTVSILYMRLLIMGHSPPQFAPADNPAASDDDVLTRFLTFSYLPFCNLWLLVYPWKLSYDYSTNTIPLVKSLSSYENLLSVTLYGGLLIIAYSYLRYQSKSSHSTGSHEITSSGYHNTIKREHSPKMKRSMQQYIGITYDEGIPFTAKSLNIMILSLAAMILPFLPATNLFFYVGFVIAERILYVPSIGFCLLIINGLNVLTKMYSEYQRAILIAITAILLLFGFRTYDRNFVWKDEESLYRSGISTSPAKSYGNLANILAGQNKTKEAEAAYKSALRFRSNMADSHYNLGILLQNQKRYEEAVESYKNAIKYRPKLAAAHLNLGVTLNEMDRKEDALEVLMNACNISDHGLKDPATHALSLTNIRYNAGKTMFELGRHQEAIITFLDSIQLMPDDYEPHSIYNMLGQVYSALKNDDNAEAWYFKALNSKKDHVPALLAYAKFLAGIGKKGRIKDAEEKYIEAIRIQPLRAESYLLYGNFLADNKRYTEAVNVLKELLDMEKDNVQALTYISTLYRDTKDYTNAEIYQLKAKRIDSEKPEIRMNLGGLYHLMGRYEEATIEYESALKLDPNNHILLENIKKLERLKKSRMKGPL